MASTYKSGVVDNSDMPNESSKVHACIGKNVCVGGMGLGMCYQGFQASAEGLEYNPVDKGDYYCYKVYYNLFSLAFLHTFG